MNFYQKNNQLAKYGNMHIFYLQKQIRVLCFTFNTKLFLSFKTVQNLFLNGK